MMFYTNAVELHAAIRATCTKELHFKTQPTAHAIAKKRESHTGL